MPTTLETDPPAAPQAQAVSHRPHTAARAKPSVTLNVTSMVDILFNLLVYFIVTVNFTADETALKAKLPAISGPPRSEPEEPTLGDKQRITVESTRDGYGATFTFRNRPVGSVATLLAALDADNNERHPKTGKLKPDKDTLLIAPAGQVRWQHVVNAFNQATRAGYTKISFADGH